MLLSGGRLVAKTPTFAFTPATSSDWWYNSERASRLGSYSQMYRSQLWVYVLVRKRALGTARLPLKVYLKDDLNRPEAKGNPYQVLISNPNPAVSPFRFWEWVSATYDNYGETFLLKRRDAGGRPFELVPLNPTGMTWAEGGKWDFDNGRTKIKDIEPDDLIHFKSYNPGDGRRGLSPLEPLRATLENEDAARTSTSAFWRNGARPGVALKHPGNLSAPAAGRLKQQWEDIARGVENTGQTVLLEEGMEPTVITLSAEEAQYIDTRKLNREEVCAAYDVPPPVVHILDRATFSNITEQMRSMYRDTMAPHLNGFESDLDSQLRAPDFSPDVYAEFLLDQVLRGDFEARADSYAKADYMTIAEKRRAENLPFIEGTEELFVNAAVVPLDEASRSRVPAAVTAANASEPPEPDAPEPADPGDGPGGKAADAAKLLQQIYLAVGKVITVDEARQLVAKATGVSLATVDAATIFADMPPMPPAAGADPDPAPDEEDDVPAAAPPVPPKQPPQAPPAGPSAETVRSVMGRLSWQQTLDQVDPVALVAKLNGDADAVLAVLAVSKAAGEDVPALRARIRAMRKG